MRRSDLARKPIETAPTDGTKIEVHWTDRDGQENRSIAQYRSLERLRAIGGDWDESDAGWWAFVDGETQKKISPHSWGAEEDED
ncbi:MAG: hypothetical protein H0T56_17455 [Pseudaminobacter sp.]|nr:hypothetical protein [Pseudaminobacter sp.]